MTCFHYTYFLQFSPALLEMRPFLIPPECPKNIERLYTSPLAELTAEDYEPLKHVLARIESIVQAMSVDSFCGLIHESQESAPKTLYLNQFQIYKVLQSATTHELHFLALKLLNNPRIRLLPPYIQEIFLLSAKDAPHQPILKTLLQSHIRTLPLDVRAQAVYEAAHTGQLENLNLLLSSCPMDTGNLSRYIGPSLVSATLSGNLPIVERLIAAIKEYKLDFLPLAAQVQEALEIALLGTTSSHHTIARSLIDSDLFLGFLPDDVGELLIVAAKNGLSTIAKTMVQRRSGDIPYHHIEEALKIAKGENLQELVECLNPQTCSVS